MSFSTLVEQAGSGTRDRQKLEAYYQGSKRLDALGVSLPPEVRVLELVVNWPRLVVDSVEERLDVEGFRLAGSDKTDDELWSWWQANNLDDESSLVHTEALVQRKAFTIVGQTRDGSPAITSHTGQGMACHIDPLTRDVAEAVRLYETPDRVKWAAHYLPDVTVYYRGSLGDWKQDKTVVHNMGTVPVTPFTNRSRIGDRRGVSEMQDVMGLTDAASRTLTNLQIAQELVAIPQRWVMGAEAKDFVDPAGNQVPRWQAYIGHVQAFENENGKAGQFEGADLRNFTEVVNQYARIVSALSGLPPDFLGFTSENPASADAIIAARERLVKRCERKQRAFGASWERTMRCAMRQDGRDASPAMRLETVWRDPSTPTMESKARTAREMFESGLLPADMALEVAGFGPEARKRAAELRQNPTLAAVGL